MTGMMCNMETTKALGERIKAARMAAGYSVQSAAKESGIARDTWRKIERGGSVHDTKRHIALQFLGLLETSEEHADVPNIDDYAMDRTGHIDMNKMFVQAIRFAATVGDLVPDLHMEAERVAAATSELYAAAIRAVQGVSDIDDLQDYADGEPVIEVGSSPSTDGAGVTPRRARTTAVPLEGDTTPRRAGRRRAE